MTRARIMACVLFVACASEKQQTQTAPESSDAMAAAMASQDMMRKVQRMQDAKMRGETECAPLETRAVPPSEAHFFGERAAAAWGKTTKGFWLDEGGKKGDRWAVTQYVQLVGVHVADGSTAKGTALTFGVVDDPAPRAVSEMGGIVLVTTGLLARLENEAQLAAVLAHEIAHLASDDPVKSYARARLVACKTTLTGLYLVEAGASDMAGGAGFVQNAKFGKTMKRFATTEGLDVATDPDVDHEYVHWYLDRLLDYRNMAVSDAELELQADRTALVLLAHAGYDGHALEKTMALDTKNEATRRKGLTELQVKTGGKAPPFPKTLKWPQP